MVQVGIFVFVVVKNAIVEVGLASEVSDARTWTIVVVQYRKHFLVAGLEFCRDHGSILGDKVAARSSQATRFVPHVATVRIPRRERYVPQTGDWLL